MGFRTSGVKAAWLHEVYQQVAQKFAAEDYSLVNKNCSHFAGELFIALTVGGPAAARKGGQERRRGQQRRKAGAGQGRAGQQGEASGAHYYHGQLQCSGGAHGKHCAALKGAQRKSE